MVYPYNGNTSFTDDSRPAAKTNTGLKLGKPVTNIAQDNGVITFDFMGGTPAVLAPVADVATHVTATGFTANWSSVENAASYTLQSIENNHRPVAKFYCRRISRIARLTRLQISQERLHSEMRRTVISKLRVGVVSICSRT